MKGVVVFPAGNAAAHHGFRDNYAGTTVALGPFQRLIKRWKVVPVRLFHSPARRPVFRGDLLRKYVLQRSAGLLSVIIDYRR